MNFLLDRVERLKWTHAALILLATFLAANWQIVSGRAFERWDAYSLGSPGYSLLGDFARAGRLLYWNPWIAGGSPDFAIAGSAVFSPDVLLFALITGMGNHAYLAFWMIIWVSGGIGMLLLARQLGAPVWGGLAVSLGFVFSGFYTGHGEHSSVIYSYSALPFIIWRLDAAFLSRRFFPAAQAGAIWGLSALAGYPALTICTIGLVAAWGVGRYFLALEIERARDWKRGLLMLMTMGAVGVLVLAPCYISAAYEGVGYSERSAPLTREFVINSNALHPGTLATLSSPALIGLKIWQRGLWSYTDVSSANLYTGGVTILLALLGLTSRTQRGWRWFLASVALFALLCALSEALPLRGWLYDLLPPTRYFRHGSMLRGFFMFFLSILALFGARDVARWRVDASVLRRLSILAPLLAIIATSAFVLVLFAAQNGHREEFLTDAHFVFLWGTLTLTGLALIRGSSKASFLPLVLLVVATVDGVLASHFSEGTMYSKGFRPLLPLPVTTSIDQGPSGFGRALGAGANVNLYFKVPTFWSYAPFENQYHKAFAADPALREMALGDNRVWFAADAPEASLTKSSFDYFERRVNSLKAPVVIRHSREATLHGSPPSIDDLDGIRKASNAINVPTTIIDYQPDKLMLEVSAPSDGWLMVTDRWSRSWRATVNGAPQPVSCADFIFRAVPVTKGRNRVEFSFHPFGMPWLVILSWSVLGVIGVLSLQTLLRPRLVAVRESLRPDDLGAGVPVLAKAGEAA